MERLNGFCTLSASDILEAAERVGTPVYVYDEALLAQKCAALQRMPSAYGLTVRYAMKANSSRALLRMIHDRGLYFDASSLNEVRRARLAGVPSADLMLTTQEVPQGADRADLEAMMLQGLRYNVCSLRQLREVGDFAAANGIPLAMRIHPGVGSGESATRNTGDKYSCFGVHLTDLEQALQYAGDRGIVFDCAHVHIGSGGDPEAWRQNIDRQLGFVERYFPQVATVNFGGGLREARMPDEQPADIEALGAYAKQRIEAFFARTGRRLHMEIEPGTYVVANAGYAVTRVIDKKQTGPEGFRFILLDGGMEVNARPLLYGSRHPFYVVSKDGRLLSSEFSPALAQSPCEAVVIGRCCESGDSQSFSVTRSGTHDIRAR